MVTKGGLPSRFNARRHGVFAKELVLDEKEKVEFAVMRNALGDQLRPATALQKVAFDLLCCAAWRCKLAVRNESKGLRPSTEERDTRKSTQGLLSDRWYGASRADLKDAIAFLAEVRDDVADGGAHADEWRDRMVLKFGQDYFENLEAWLPPSVSEIYLNEHLVAHERAYGLPLPENDKARNLSAQPRLAWAMGVKIIDLTIQHLRTLLILHPAFNSEAGVDTRIATLEASHRYFTGAARNLQRAVDWYLSC